jgi:hypothetical protein
VQEDEALALPVARVLVAVDLTVHPQFAVRQPGFLARALVRLWPVDDPGQRVGP